MSGACRVCVSALCFTYFTFLTCFGGLKLHRSGIRLVLRVFASVAICGFCTFTSSLPSEPAQARCVSGACPAFSLPSPCLRFLTACVFSLSVSSPCQWFLTVCAFSRSVVSHRLCALPACVVSLFVFSPCLWLLPACAVSLFVFPCLCVLTVCVFSLSVWSPCPCFLVVCVSPLSVLFRCLCFSPCLRFLSVCVFSLSVCSPCLCVFLGKPLFERQKGAKTAISEIRAKKSPKNHPINFLITSPDQSR